MLPIGTGDTNELHVLSWRRVFVAVALFTMFGLGFVSQHIIQAVEAGISPIIQFTGPDQWPDTKSYEKQKIAEAISVCRSSLDEDYIASLAGIIRKESKKYNYDWELILAIIKTESHFDAEAVSSKGARGLMQVLPSTAEWMSSKIGIKYEGHESLYDPEYNVKLGTRYLYMLHKRYGNIEEAIAAYNRGPKGLARYLNEGNELPSEYLAKVMDYYRELKDNDAS